MVKENMINPEMKVREREGKRLLTLGFEGDLGGICPLLQQSHTEGEDGESRFKRLCSML